MDFYVTFPVAVALAMDAFAVAVVSGSSYKDLAVRHAVRMALFFGGFQAFMPLLGALAGLTIRRYIQSYDHWVAFALLCGVGVKMIYESFKIRTVEKGFNPASVPVLLGLSVATSIDALAVGVTLSLLVSDIILAAAVIGAVTFVLSYAGTAIGKKLGHFFENRIETLGGVVLIALGTKILLTHILS